MKAEIRKEDSLLYTDLKTKLKDFDKYKPLKGIRKQEQLHCLLLQLIDSIRRVKYATKLSENSYSSLIANPHNTSFNPLKAALWHYSQGDVDEAFWLIFLFVHFGKHPNSNWNLLRSVYGQLNNDEPLSWKKINSDPEEFRLWLSSNYDEVRSTGNFGNHRKYESLRTDSLKGTDTVFQSYIDWINKFGSHAAMVQNAAYSTSQDPVKLFNYLYQSMKVLRFGRTAKFDYLTMLGKLKFVNLVPSSAYITEATGPLRGGRLLVSGDINSNLSPKELDSYFMELNDYLCLYFGIQVLEDAICNWQKNPKTYEHFKG